MPVVADRPGEDAAPELSSTVERDSSTVDDSWGSPVGSEPQQTYDTNKPAYIGDRRFYRIVVWFLGIVAVAAAGGTILLGLMRPEVPDALVALGSASIGALAGLIGGGRQ